MAQITITGNIKISSSGPDAGQGSTIQFLLSDYMKRASDNALIVPAVESAALTAVTGAFSKALESTRDAIPATRFWRVMVRGTFGGKPVNVELGKIQIRSTPTTQNLYDLLADTLIEEGTDRLMVEVPTGDVDGSNTTFLTSTTPVPNTFMLFNSASGGAVSPDAYAIDDSGTIEYVLPPAVGDFHICVYRAG